MGCWFCHSGPHGSFLMIWFWLRSWMCDLLLFTALQPRWQIVPLVLGSRRPRERAFKRPLPMKYPSKRRFCVQNSRRFYNRFQVLRTKHTTTESALNVKPAELWPQRLIFGNEMVWIPFLIHKVPTVLPPVCSRWNSVTSSPSCIGIEL